MQGKRNSVATKVKIEASAAIVVHCFDYTLIIHYIDTFDYMPTECRKKKIFCVI